MFSDHEFHVVTGSGESYVLPAREVFRMAMTMMMSVSAKAMKWMP
jgi:hypothetical protein